MAGLDYLDRFQNLWTPNPAFHLGLKLVFAISGMSRMTWSQSSESLAGRRPTGQDYRYCYVGAKIHGLDMLEGLSWKFWVDVAWCCLMLLDVWCCLMLLDVCVVCFSFVGYSFPSFHPCNIGTQRYEHFATKSEVAALALGSQRDDLCDIMRLQTN